MKQILRDFPAQFPEISQKIDLLLELKEKIQSLLPDELKPYCRLGNFEKNVLTLLADNASWATRCRFYQSELLTQLRRQPAFARVSSIVIKVARLEINKTPPAAPPPLIGPNTIETLQRSSQSVEDPALKASFERLANTLNGFVKE